MDFIKQETLFNNNHLAEEEGHHRLLELKILWIFKLDQTQPIKGLQGIPTSAPATNRMQWCQRLQHDQPSINNSQHLNLNNTIKTTPKLVKLLIKRHQTGEKRGSQISKKLDKIIGLRASKRGNSSTEKPGKTRQGMAKSIREFRET